MAPDKRAKAKEQIAKGIDPAQARRVAKRQSNVAASNTFEAIMRVWHANKADSWKESTAKNVLHRLENTSFP
jgi:hypothetical protein